MTARQGGSSLLVVLWALALLTGAVFGWARWVQQDLQMRGQAAQAVEARAMAHSGITVALNPKITKHSPQLQVEMYAGAGYQVRMFSEGSKLNINWLLLSNEPRRVGMFKQWLESRGIGFKERERMVDCLLDYTDVDNLRRANGAEDEGIYHPTNRPLENVDELLRVKGTEPLTSQPGWRDALTTESTGPIDLLAAPPEVLRLIPGFGQARIGTLLQMRRGRDGIDGTADDPEVKSLTEFLQRLGFGPAEAQTLPQLIMINDPVIRVWSRGTSGKVVRQVEAVARKGGLNPTIIYWKE